MSKVDLTQSFSIGVIVPDPMTLKRVERLNNKSVFKNNILMGR